MTRNVNLKDYDKEWANDYQVEQCLIRSTLGALVHTIDHVGSTSIPGMRAKPIIDIALTVNDIHDVNEETIDALKQIGYDYVPKENFPERRFFRRGEWGKGTHHLHVYAKDSQDWKKQIVFRDYLLNHPKEMHEYIQLKENLAQTTDDRLAYTNAKGPFVAFVLKKAGFN